MRRGAPIPCPRGRSRAALLPGSSARAAVGGVVDSGHAVHTRHRAAAGLRGGLRRRFLDHAAGLVLGGGEHGGEEEGEKVGQGVEEAEEAGGERGAGADGAWARVVGERRLCARLGRVSSSAAQCVVVERTRATEGRRGRGAERCSGSRPRAGAGDAPVRVRYTIAPRSAPRCSEHATLRAIRAVFAARAPPASSSCVRATRLLRPPRVRRRYLKDFELAMCGVCN